MNKAAERKKWEENLGRHWKDKYSLLNIFLEELSNEPKDYQEIDKQIRSLFDNANLAQYGAMDALLKVLCGMTFTELNQEQIRAYNMLWHDEKQRIARQNKGKTDKQKAAEKPDMCHSCGRDETYVQKYSEHEGYFCLGCGADHIELDPTCRKCSTMMKVGVCIPPAAPAEKGTQCFGGYKHQGEAPLEKCWKCPACGFSMEILKKD